MKQIISKNGRVECITTVPYPSKTIRVMKEAGYEITQKKDCKEEIIK